MFLGFVQSRILQATHMRPHKRAIVVAPYGAAWGDVNGVEPGVFEVLAVNAIFR